MSDQLAKLAVVHWALKAGNNAYTLDRIYEELRDPEIHSIVVELQEIQTHLNVLDSWFRDERISRLMPNELKDIETAIGSCTRSIAKLDDAVSAISTLRRGEPTRLVWSEIKARFKDEEGQVLLNQLNVHRIFLTKLFPVLRLHFKPQSRAEVERVHQQVRNVNGITDGNALRLRQWEDYHRRMAEQAQRNIQPPSPDYSPTGFVPMRPFPAFPYSAKISGAHHHGQHNAGRALSQKYPRPIAGEDGKYYNPYPSPPTSTSSNPSASPPQQPVPRQRPRGNTPAGPTAPPIRPSRALSRHGSRESLRSSSPGARHLSRQNMRAPSPGPNSRVRERTPSPGPHGILRRRPSSVGPYPRLPQRRRSISRPENEGSHCFGQHVEGLVIAETEIPVLEADCDNNLNVAILRNDESGATRVVCTIDSVGSWVNDSSRHQVRFQSSCKLAFLSIKRQGRALYLLRRRQPWARLCFDDFENMVFFFHSFLALRTSGPEAPEIESGEKFLAGEVSEFDALIDDNGNLNRLYILRDNDTGKVRIAAMLQQDKNEDLVVWTAFLQDHFEKSDWMRRVSYMITFDRLSVSHFRDVFLLAKPQDDFTLTFLNTNDSIRFEETILALSYNYTTNIFLP